MLAITAPIFILVLLGYVATLKNITNKSDIRALGTFVVKFSIPALIFKSLAQRSFVEIINADYLMVYGLGSLSVFLMVFAIARFVQGRDMASCALLALGSSVSNSGFIGYPIAMLVVGPTVVVALALSMIIENVIMIPLALTLADSAGHGGKPARAVIATVIARLLRNPMIIAIILGSALSLSGLKLPAPILKPVDMLAMASGAVALFAVGGALVGLRVRGMIGDIARIVAGKLLLHPLAVFVALLLAPRLDPDLRKAMLIFASVPMLSIYPLLGQAYGEEKVCSAALMVATTLSFLSVSGVLLLL